LENRGVVTLKNKNGEREGRTLCDLLIFEREHTSIKKKLWEKHKERLVEKEIKYTRNKKNNNRVFKKIKEKLKELKKKGKSIKKVF